MVLKSFTQMETESFDDLIFGHAKNPVEVGWEQKIGYGNVVPNVKIADDDDKAVKAICSRVEAIGLPAIQIEIENATKDSAALAAANEQLEALHENIGTKASIMVSVADDRVEKEGLRESDADVAITETLESNAQNGASILSMETIGGAEVCNFAIKKADPRALLYGVGVLGSIDMEYMWTKISDIAGKNNVAPGGDSATAQANSVMYKASGLTEEKTAHTLAAVGRAMAAVRSLVAIECGATGPTKDAAYENPIIKAITGVPISAQPRNADSGNSVLTSNLSASVCDVWTEDLDNLGNGASLMNAATQIGTNKELRASYAMADKYRDPQGVILAYDNAYKIGEAIIAEDSAYTRSAAAASKAIELINEAIDDKKLYITKFERDSLDSAQKTIEQLPDKEKKFLKTCLKRYGKKVKTHDPAQYEL
ncbi:MAG: methanol--corrinoid methyltransferase [Methanosphaera stadtmanae]|jgi:methanol--5-hydroxybenzimidazolylcobamide Co-methyltransferase|nr:methanol--corrinoid methyltransferase [Methanosphaera stadtmanae]